MIDFHNFDEVFYFSSDFSYDSSSVEAIEGHRKGLEGLFVDKVLKALEVKRPTRIYPPKSNIDLRSLHQAICAGSSADHPKMAMLYYLLLDYDSMNKGQTQSDAFEEGAMLPKSYQILMKGLWHMDREEFEIAIQYLTHPALIPTFPEEILETLVRNSKQDDFTLPLAYYSTVHPNIKTPNAVASLFSAIARTSVTEAFYFSRLQQDVGRRKIFEMLISIVLQRPASEKAASCATELVNLPFSPEEEEWFEEFLIKGEGRGIRKAKDTLMIRRIGTGKLSEALSLDLKGGKTSSGLSWDILQDSIQEGLGPRVEL